MPRLVFVTDQAIDRISPVLDRPYWRTPAPPAGVFCCGLCVGNREAGADRQGGQLIDRVTAGAPVGELLLIEALGHARMGVVTKTELRDRRTG